MAFPAHFYSLDRYKISDCAGAALATALLEDLGVISTDSFQYVFDKYKIRRARLQNRNKQQKKKEKEIEGNIHCIRTDGKRDKKTKVIKESEVNGEVVEVKEEVTESTLCIPIPTPILLTQLWKKVKEEETT